MGTKNISQLRRKQEIYQSYLPARLVGVMRFPRLPMLINLLCVFGIPLILFTFFSFPLSVTKHQSLFSSAYQLLTVAKSNRWAMFLMFNLIIIFILSSSDLSVGNSDMFFPPLLLDYASVRKYDIDVNSNDNEDVDEYYSYDSYEEDDDDDFDMEDADNEDENDDNDLERRVEEFIAKVNKTWQEELLKERQDFYSTLSEFQMISLV